MGNNGEQINSLQQKIRSQRTAVISLSVVVVALLVVNILQFMECRVATSCKYNTKDEIAKYPLIDPAREYIAQEDAVTNLQSLRDYLWKVAGEEKDVDVSIYYEFLNTGANISINPDMRYYSASLAKLPVAMVVMKKVEAGEWLMDNELVLFQEDLDADSGELYRHAPVGTRFTIEELVKAALEESDNTAHKILLRNLTLDEINGLIDSVGLYDLFDDNQEVTAKEYSRILRALYTASYLRREFSQQLLEWLTQVEFQGFLAQGIPEGVPFARKYGQHVVRYIYVESGIVYYPKRPYTLTVMIKGKLTDAAENAKKARELMAEISREAYNYAQGI